MTVQRTACAAADEPVDISVVLSTYNRCDMLPRALQSITSQAVEGLRYEVVVVDNNSTDRTREVGESFAKRHRGLIRYVFERRQGLSYGRNTGIAHASAPIIAFTDDDIRPNPDWLQRIKHAMDQHPEVEVVGGRVLPEWGNPPPAWLTREHWAPLALVDYGDEPCYTNAENPICLVGANSAYRRELFARLGGFPLEAQRIGDGIGSLDESDLQRQMWRAGIQGLYVPEIVVVAEVQPERLTPAYHRRWHTGHGRSYGILRDAEFEESRVRLLDVPGHVYRAASKDAWRWLRSRLRGRSPDAFRHEMRLRFFFGFARSRWARSPRRR